MKDDNGRGRSGCKIGLAVLTLALLLMLAGAVAILAAIGGHLR